MKKGDTLFVIEQTMYKAQVKEAEAQLDGAKAQLLNAEAEFTRQETLLRQNVTAQNTYDQAKAKRDSAHGPTSRTTKATSPSPRPTWATRRCRRRSTASCPSISISVGELVGNGKATKLATIVQLDPIYVEFNVSEQDVLKIRQNLANRRLTVEELGKIPLDIGLMNEEGYPAHGLPELRLARDRCADRHHPGARPVQESRSRPDPGLLHPHQGADGPGRARPSLLIPNRVIAEDQAGKYAAGRQQGQRRRAEAHQDRAAPGRRAAGDHRGPQRRRPRRADHQRPGGARRQGRARSRTTIPPPPPGANITTTK